jgi:hypothetical protein
VIAAAELRNRWVLVSPLLRALEASSVASFQHSSRGNHRLAAKILAAMKRGDTHKVLKKVMCMGPSVDISLVRRGGSVNALLLYAAKPILSLTRL